MKEWLVKSGLAVIAIFAPVHTIMIGAGVLIIIDLVTGLLAAWKTKEKITSNGLKRTVIKMLVYQLAVITGFIVQTYMLHDSFEVTKIVAAVIGLVEAASILENLNRINGAPIFRSLINKINEKNPSK